MNKIWVLISFIFLKTLAFSQIDTLVDVGNLKLNFQIVKGHGRVILLESLSRFSLAFRTAKWFPLDNPKDPLYAYTEITQ